jgi:hypothetical protein
VSKLVINNIGRRLFLFISILLLVAFTISNKVRRKFNIEIYLESNISAGFKIYLNQDRLYITECRDVKWGCKNAKISFKKEITKQQSDTIYSALRRLKIDTLKSVYNFQNTDQVAIFDGAYGHYKFYGDGIKLTRTTTYAMSPNAIDSLENLINRMVVPENYWKINLMFH